MAHQAQWHNGDRKLKKLGGILFTGGLLIEKKADLPYPTETVDLENKEVTAYTFQEASLSIFGYRLRYFSGEGKDRKYYAYRDYRQATAEGHKLRGNLQMFAFLDDNPLIISFNGTASTEIIQQLKRIKEALALTEKNGSTQPLHAFKLTLTPGEHVAKGNGKQSEATPPNLNLPSEFDRDWFLSRFVSKECLTQLNTHAAAFTEWANQWYKDILNPEQQAEAVRLLHTLSDNEAVRNFLIEVGQLKSRK